VANSGRQPPPYRETARAAAFDEAVRRELAALPYKDRAARRTQLNKERPKAPQPTPDGLFIYRTELLDGQCLDTPYLLEILNLGGSDVLRKTSGGNVRRDVDPSNSRRKYETIFARGGLSHPIADGTVLPRTPTLLIVFRDALNTHPGHPRRDRFGPLWTTLMRVLRDLSVAENLPERAANDPVAAIASIDDLLLYGLTGTIWWPIYQPSAAASGWHVAGLPRRPVSLFDEDGHTIGEVPARPHDYTGQAFGAYRMELIRFAVQHKNGHIQKVNMGQPSVTAMHPESLGWRVS
jgi:hypothetical protein